MSCHRKVFLIWFLFPSSSSSWPVVRSTECNYRTSCVCVCVGLTFNRRSKRKPLMSTHVQLHMATSASNNNKSYEGEIKEEKYSSAQGRSEITIDEQMVKYHKSSNSTRAHALRSTCVCVCACVYWQPRVQTLMDDETDRRLLFNTFESEY